MKIASLIAFSSSLALAVSCQKEESVPIEYSSIVAAIEANLGRPYSCSIQRIVRFQPGSFGQIEMRSDFLYENEESSYALRSISAKGYPTLTSFTRRENGLEHTVKESMPADSERWFCDLWEQGEYPLGVEAVFPQGGWSVIAQVDQLIQVFGKTQATISEGIVQLSWARIPLAVREDMLSQFGIHDRGPHEKEEIRLTINLAQGTPDSIGVYWGKGESIVHTFADFVFTSEDIQVLATQLEEGAAVPESFQCVCDFSSPQMRR